MAFTNLKSNQPATNQKIFNRDATETRDDEKMIGEEERPGDVSQAQQVSLVFPVAARFGEQLDQILEHLLGEDLRYGERLDVLFGAVLDLSDLFQLDTNSRERGDGVVETLVVKIKTLGLQQTHCLLVAGFLFQTLDLQLVVH
jgi:hypothetical protein